MAQTIKSVLLFDYDSIYRSLSERAPGVEDLLGARAGVWLEAIESGEIVQASHVEAGTRRRFQVKRCYADPKLLGKNRGWLTANGVQVVDCTPSVGLERGAADVHLVLDSLDAAEGEPDEIILLSADTDLTPLLFRLKALNQRIVIYVSEATAVSYKTFADGVIDEANLIEMLSHPSEQSVGAQQGSIPRPPRISATKAQPAKPAPAPAAPPRRAEPRQDKAPPAQPSRRPVNREALAELVRRIHDLTSVPLFSPKAFAELFRILADDVTEHGYKFPSTTDNVTAKMVELGRNVTKRQIGFVIKGLALRGHVFGTDDSPELLAEAFYEQVLYLVENAKVELSDAERELVQAWIMGLRPEARATSTAPRAPAARDSATVRSTPPVREQASPRFAAPPVAEPPRARPPAATAENRRDVKGRPGPMRTASRPARMAEEPPPAARPQESDLARRMGRNGGGAASPRLRTPPPAREMDAKREAELEDSILSAIADAVDVLADDNAPAQPQRASARAARERAPIAPDVEPPLDAVVDDDEGADEIGDEIQRILASYNEGR